jgi:hypothetical protein
MRLRMVVWSDSDVQLRKQLGVVGWWCGGVPV